MAPELQDKTQETYDHKAVKNMADLVAENIRLLQAGKEVNSVIHTDIEDLDVDFGGLRMGELVIVGGRPAMGKTQMLVNLALTISKTMPLLFITLDLSEYLLTNRFISFVSNVPTNDISQNKLSEEQKEKLATLDQEFAQRKLFVYEGINNSITTITSYCLNQIRENGVKVIVLDYLQLITYPPHRKFRDQEIGYICMELKNIAKEHNVCIIVASQLSRSVEQRWGIEGKYPLLSDLRDSGSIEQLADKVLFIHRPEYYKIFEDERGNNLRGVVEIIVAKNRNGRTGDFKMRRDDLFTNLQSEKKDFSFPPDRLMELDSHIELKTPF